LGKLLLAFASTVILLFGSRANINGSAIFYWHDLCVCDF
jgi:hypothetical protein